MNDPMIRVSRLTKRFGRLQVLDALELEIPRGETTAVLGPNGAGKTTFIKSILGLVRPDGGEIILDGERLNGSYEYRSRIGYMPQIARYPENLTAREIIRMIRDLRSDETDVDGPSSFGPTCCSWTSPRRGSIPSRPVF